MAIISNIPTANASQIINLDYLPERLLYDFAGSPASFDNFSVVTSGVQLMSVTDYNRFTALAKFDNQMLQVPNSSVPGTLNTQVSNYLRLAVGRVNKQTTINLTDSGDAASYPVNIYAASTGISGMARRAVESSINPSANATFNNFEALFIEPNNLLRSQITFENGFTDEYTPQELTALFAAFNQSDLGGALGGGTGSGLVPYITIAGSCEYGNISQVVLYASGSGSVIVLKSDYVTL
jgi:hypothetical protein